MQVPLRKLKLQLQVFIISLNYLQSVTVSGISQSNNVKVSCYLSFASSVETAQFVSALNFIPSERPVTRQLDRGSNV